MNDHGKDSGTNLLAFRSAAKHLADGPPNAGFNLNLVRGEHAGSGLGDIAMLRRPIAVESLESPRMDEQDALAHDARNLVTSLALISELLGEPGVLGEEHRHFASDLKLLAAPLSSMVEKMVAVSRSRADSAAESRRGVPIFKQEPLRPVLRSAYKAGATAQKAEWQDERTDVGVMVKSCERLLGAIAGPRVAVQISYERGLGELALSGEGVTRVLINLVRNASEAMPNGGQVAITVRRSIGLQPSAILSVQDKGIGIPAHAMGQIFQAGFSSKRTQEKWPAPKHHGLGLTIVRDLVEGAGGSVRVVSTLSKGTTFEIKLPCRRS